MEGSPSEARKGPAHARRRALPKANEERLAEIGKQLPPPSDEELEIVAGLRRERRRRRLITWAVVLVVVALVAGAIAQWVRPLPRATVQTESVRLPGTAPPLAWPSTGEAAAAVVGVGALGQVRGSQAVPVAGLAQVLTAEVVLSDHPLAPGADGPAIPVTADTLAAYQLGQASQDSEVPVAAGESLTELQALEGLLVDAGNDMATLLADWDAGSVGAFVAKMNAAAVKLGLTSTHITDPSGADPATTSTADDLVRLGEAAMSIPVLRQIVSLGEVSVPMTNVVYNLNFDLGQDGIVGIKTGSDSSAQGCYLVAAQQDVGGKNVTVVGAVLGQPGGSLGPNTAAVDAGDALVRSVFTALHNYTIFAPGQKAGEIEAPWGATAPVTVDQPVSAVGWPGLVVTVATRTRSIKGALRSGAVVGTLQAGVGRSSEQAALHTVAALSGPGPWWRLTR
jgi:serine-type D-Ala-D-Ala carboxypeptidase (penicillin-binding protein 5/6)